MFLALPRDDLDAGDLGALSKVNHPRGSVDVEVVEDRAAVHAYRHVAVYGSRRVTLSSSSSSSSVIFYF